ncbi:uncharacterized protein LOC131505336 isoform X1 [Neofelis nebulosa]|uniref:uncharacterized protein LOC131505336 isoform X1 n=2 Tax=Neofelis nebulosa TaxID=61452 RepID=UPI002729A062|nr:uncharacterized protein LOC131505336 isoform X1 [Neofelis nebulosa]XP_058574777.1 uncharacterized protein LOC131505336 isoform X1 [Neofelis nebulosa]XP_058574778.1 uncharacterized protein LOC131505336 isoform X1 [Neofelis nebulosa]XP_058574779.1 uncharacterized protein LOC131505336 isoform X1 [Neofelis nebulosa]
MIFLRNWGRAKKNPVERRILTLLSCPSQCSLFVTSNNAPRMAENTLSNPAPIQEQSRSPPRITSTDQDVLSAITQKFTRLLGTLCHQWRTEISGFLIDEATAPRTMTYSWQTLRNYLWLKQILGTLPKTTNCVRSEDWCWKKKKLLARLRFPDTALFCLAKNRIPLHCLDYPLWKQVRTMVSFGSKLISLGKSGVNSEQRIHVYSRRYA